MKPDTFTRTEADAAAYERDRASDRHLDDRPTRAQIEAEEAYEDWRWDVAHGWHVVPDPWGDYTPKPTRDYPPLPAEPPF